MVSCGIHPSAIEIVVELCITPSLVESTSSHLVQLSRGISNDIAIS